MALTISAERTYPIKAKSGEAFELEVLGPVREDYSIAYRRLVDRIHARRPAAPLVQTLQRIMKNGAPLVDFPGPAASPATPAMRFFHGWIARHLPEDRRPNLCWFPTVKTEFDLWFGGDLVFWLADADLENKDSYGRVDLSTWDKKSKADKLGLRLKADVIVTPKDFRNGSLAERASLKIARLLSGAETRSHKRDQVFMTSQVVAARQSQPAVYARDFKAWRRSKRWV